MIRKAGTLTTTATTIHVTCSEFCGLPISETGEAGKAQHAMNCGANEADLKALDDELSAKRIQAAVPAEEADEELNAALPADDAPAATFRCKCGESFPDWPELGQHQTGTGHSGMWTEPNDALDDEALLERENSDTVNGVVAKIDHEKPAKGQKIEKVDYSHLWRDPEIELEDVFALQDRIDDGTLTIGGIAAGKACIGKATFADPTDGSRVEVACPHKCFARTVRKNECDLEHTHQETLEQVCLIHGIVTWGGGVPAAGLGPLFPPADA